MNDIQDFSQRIYTLLDIQDYETARLLLEEKLPNILDNDLPFLLETAGLYIDLGDESNNSDLVNVGLNILLHNVKDINSIVTPDSLDYCLGNAYQALFRISNKIQPDYFPKPENITNLFQAKQYYLKSYKVITLTELNPYKIQVLNNLANNLINSGRIVEALQLHDTVLAYNPDFVYTLVSKADALIYLTRSSNCHVTTALFVEIYSLYSSAEKHPIPLPHIVNKIQADKQHVITYLQTQNFDLSQIPVEHYRNELEYHQHTGKVKFYIDNFLSLSEHGLYCKCDKSKNDDLMIGHKGFVTNSTKIVQLELLCNRIKSEFSLSRELLFDYFNSEDQDDEIHYKNLVDGILNGIKYEKLRTCFRMCFGILDKIAEGIFFMYDLHTEKKEKIYFDAFYNSNKNSKRWEQINSVKNIHLTALYSIACDLSITTGEYGFYKVWRNRLEHGVFSLKNDNYISDRWEDEKFSTKVDFIDFENESKRLLQITRSAIFSYVFCVRQELIE